MIKKTLSFDLRTSLYNDPLNYTFTITAKNTTTVSDKLTLLNKNNIWDWKEMQSTGGLTEVQVRNIVKSMIDADDSGTPDWEDHTTYYMTTDGDGGAWGDWK